MSNKKVIQLLKEVEELPDTKKGIDLRRIKIAIKNLLNEYNNK